MPILRQRKGLQAVLGYYTENSHRARLYYRISEYCARSSGISLRMIILLLLVCISHRTESQAGLEVIRSPSKLSSPAARYIERNSRTRSAYT